MEIFDKDGNFLGEFISKQGDDIGDAFGASWILGLLCLFWKPIPTIIVIALWLVLKIIVAIVVFAFKLTWWLIRLPFTLLFLKDLPIWD